MRKVHIGYVVHITSLATGAQWYSGERNEGGEKSPYVYREKVKADRYAALLSSSSGHLLADVEEYEYTPEGEENA